MKILITCQYYWPDNFLINDISKELVNRGHEVIVLTGLPDYATSKIPKKYKRGRNRKETHNGIKIIRVPIIARHKGFIFRVLNYLSYFITSSIYAKTHKFDIDVIYSWQTAPVFMINPAMILKKKLKKPLFIYVLDIWPDQMKIWHVGEKNPIFKIVQKYCKKAYGSGDLVGITSRPFKKYLETVCEVDEKRIVYLPQHSEKIEFDTKKKKGDITNFIYAGNIGYQQNLECLLEAVSLMKTKKKFLVNIYGEGSSYNKCVDLSHKLSLQDKVKFYGRVSKEELNKIYPNMDAFLLTLCSEKEMGFAANTVPAKLQGYMSAGKPILASIDGGANEIIKESNCGAVVPSGDSKAYAKVLDDFIEHQEKYKDCGANAIKYFNENYEKEIIIGKLEKILQDLAKKEGKGNE